MLRSATGSAEGTMAEVSNWGGGGGGGDDDDREKEHWKQFQKDNEKKV